MMNCQEVCEKLSAYLDHEIGSSKRAIISEHLASCARCRAEYEKIKRMSKRLDEFLPLPLPSALADSILLEIKTLNRWRSKYFGYLAAASLLLGILAGGVLANLYYTHSPIQAEETKQIRKVFSMDSFSPHPSGSLTDSYTSLTFEEDAK